MAVLHTCVALRQGHLELTIARGHVLVTTQEIAEEQGKLLAEAPRTADMDVHPAQAWRLAKVAFRPFAIVVTKDIPYALQGSTERIGRLEGKTEIWVSITGSFDERDNKGR